MVFVLLRSVGGNMLFDYSIYSLPLITMFLVLPYNVLTNNVNYNNDNIIFKFFIVNIFISIFYIIINLISQNIFSRTFMELYFLNAPILTVFLLSTLKLDKSFLENKLKLMSIGFVCIYLFNVDFNLVKILFLIIDLCKNLFLDSSLAAEFESSFSFIFAFFSLLFFYKRQYLFFTFFSIFTLVSYKRIALFGLFTCIIILIFLRIFNINFTNNKKKIAIVGLSMNLFLIYMFILIINGYFDYYVKLFFGKSLNFLMMGRMQLFSYAFEINNNTYNIFGLGLGSLSHSLTSNYFTKLTNIHSDILKTYIEGGLIIFCYTFYFYYKLASVNSLTVALLILFNFIIISDNIMIYFSTMFIFFMIIFIYSKDFKTKQAS
tara:strand:- start:9582 stop:10709 length:1128 start_codon:yes stop_codon:yes gene_type:complete